MDSIAKHRPFKTTGQDFSETNPMFAHYFYKYYISCIKPIYEETVDQSSKAELDAEIKESFHRMAALAQQCQLSQDEGQNMQRILQYTELMFARNDHYHQQEGLYTKRIAEDYLTIFRLYEIVNRFGRLDQGQNKRRIYSKKKFIDIMKELKKNPALQHAKPKEASQVQQSVKKSVIPQPPPPFEEKKIEKIESAIKQSQFKPFLPKPTKVISYEKVQMQMEANKALENAISELSFDRFKHARDEVMHVLELLDQLIEN